MSKYPLALSSWGIEEYEAIQEVIASDLFSMGEKVRDFENDFAKFLGVPYCVMVNSGSSANLLAIASLFYQKENPLRAGDEVIVPAVSWSTTYFPLQQYGLKVKFVDIDLKTLNIDLESLSRAITSKTRLIVAVNLLGNPNDFDQIEKMTEGCDITLVEDNCESLGATYNGMQAGTFGELGTYSMYFSHHISTMEGGMIAVKDEELYHILLSLRAHGWTRNLPSNNKVTKMKDPNSFYESFKFVLPGYNVRPLEMSGAIGVCQLKKLPEFLEIRRRNAKYFLDRISDFNEIQFQKELGTSSWFGFSLILKGKLKGRRDDLVSCLEDHDIECRPIVGGNFTHNPAIKYFNYEVFEELESSDVVTREGLFLGNHHVPLESELDHFFEVLSTFCER